MICLIKEDGIMGIEIGAITSNQTSMSASTANKKDSKKPEGAAAIVTAFKINKKKTRKKKRLSYNFKKISNQILMSKSTTSAGKVLTRARGTYITLLLKKNSSEYDAKEVKSAIEHAKEMVRIAKKRKKHMEEEELAVNNGEAQLSEGIEMEEEEDEDENSDYGQDMELSADELEELAEELKELTRESMEESLKEMADELINTVHKDMSKEEIEELKRRHRQDELKDIMEADMKYLKALFEKLQKEKQQSASSAAEAFDTSNEPAAVSLELGGVEVPVQAQESAAELVEGGAVDVSL